MDINNTYNQVFANFYAKFPPALFEKGTIIHTPGERPHNIYVVEEGFVKLYALSPEGNEKLLVILKPGEVFSLTSALLNRPTSFYAEALKRTKLRAIPREQFMTFMHSDVKHMDILMSVLIKIIAVLDNRVFTLSLTRAYDRLISRLAILIEVFGLEQTDGSILIDAPLTHQDIGNSINLSRESTSKAMARLQAEGILHYKNGTIIVHKPEAIKGPIN